MTHTPMHTQTSKHTRILRSGSLSAKKAAVHGMYIVYHEDVRSVSL